MLSCSVSYLLDCLSTSSLTVMPNILPFFLSFLFLFRFPSLHRLFKVLLYFHWIMNKLGPCCSVVISTQSIKKLEMTHVEIWYLFLAHVSHLVDVVITTPGGRTFRPWLGEIMRIASFTFGHWNDGLLVVFWSSCIQSLLSQTQILCPEFHPVGHVHRAIPGAREDV